jgi:hypothetical protein
LAATPQQNGAIFALTVRVQLPLIDHQIASALPLAQ